ncbi:synergin gamma-like [Rhinophrynus dorsalis]
MALRFLAATVSGEDEISGSFMYPVATDIGSSSGAMPMQPQVQGLPVTSGMQTNVANIMGIEYPSRIPLQAVAMQGGMPVGPMQTSALPFMTPVHCSPQYMPDIQKQSAEEQRKRLELQQKKLEEERKRRQFQEQKQKLRLLSHVKPKIGEKARDDALEAIKGNLDGFSRDARMHTTPTSESKKSEIYKTVLETTITASGIETTKLYPILMSSGLPKETLGQIWALANQTTPGKLTKEELYTVLAMIAATQI